MPRIHNRFLIGFRDGLMGRLTKHAQFTSMMPGNMDAKSLSLGDILAAIHGDQQMDPQSKAHLLTQIVQSTRGAPAETPISALLAMGLGGILGWIISKYFGMGVMGRLASTAVGAGIGGAIYNRGRAPEQYPGYAQVGSSGSFSPFLSMLGGH